MPTAKEAILKKMNKNLLAMKPGIIRAFDEKVSSIPDIVKLTLGEPDFDVPDHIKAAAIKSIEDNDSHYAPSNGSMALRQAISSFMKDRYGLDYKADSEIIVTVGATEGIFDSLTAVLNPGDGLLVPSPIFPFYVSDGQLEGVDTISVDTSDDGFKLTPAKLSATIAEYGDKIKALVLNFPSNPTGVTYSADELKALADVISKTDIVVISDEIYAELSYDQKHVSIAKFLPDQTLVLNGVSKSHAMTGYRIGFIAGPANLISLITIVHQCTTTTASNPAMAAAVEAFGTEAGKEDTKKMKEAYRQRRDFLYEALTKLGFQIANPGGAFYLFAKIPEGQNQDDMAFCVELAEKAKVAFIPGSAFGKGGQGYVRLSYAASMDNLKKVASRVTKFMNDK
ncbi:aminotransferase class I/II-fold pyridoxal phosphate-dependent enzyme [Eupransor demetentiae]|uniref:Aminotransferase n=1 Tax=Eupransor demetentiae TaxID=3109584 RepID=A0ABP0ER49_9LACO|nr:Aspartate/methionine/tyrosine aminotransferase (AspB) [Lactobacillaceae bacterium LMG 33000]